MEDLESMIRAEMANVLSEFAVQGRNPSQQFDPYSHDHRQKETASVAERIQLLRDRIVTLEDVLAKSEADRAAVYMKYEQVNRALSAANEEKLALMHEFHDANHGPVAEATMLLTAARDENDRMRHQLTLLSEKYDTEVPALRAKIREQENEIKKLKKYAKQHHDDRYESVTLADLHYSNERLSAQLAKLQVSPAPIFDESKFRECEQSIIALSNEVAALEDQMQRMRTQHSEEKKELLDSLEKQQREFAVERAECDRVIGIMSAKLEGLVSENNLLKMQLGRGLNRTPTQRESIARQ
jgi:predicted  nucleic acid-binding Zn-ribbon protein